MSTPFYRMFVIAALGLALVAPASLAGKMTTPTDVDHESQTADSEKKRGKRAGLRVGSWQVDGLNEVSGASYTDSLNFEGYFEKDLDVRLSLESTVGMWNRSRELEQSQVGGGTSTEQVDSYVVPMFSGLKFYPLRHTTERRLTPFVNGGIGVVLGLEKRDSTGTGLVGGGGSSTQTGFGFRFGTGLDWNLGDSYGLSFGARYQRLRFDEPLDGDRHFRGVAVDAGFTYRFNQG